MSATLLDDMIFLGYRVISMLRTLVGRYQSILDW